MTNLTIMKIMKNLDLIYQSCANFRLSKTVLEITLTF